MSDGNFQFGPEKIFTGTNTDGTEYRINQYDPQTIWTYDFFNGFAMLFIGVIFCSLAPIFMMVMTILYFNGKFNPTYIVAALVSGYFLFDASHGWLFLRLLDLFCTGNEILVNYLVCLNIGFILTWLVLMVFGGLIHKLCCEAGSVFFAWVCFLTCVGFCIFIGYMIGYDIVGNDVTWIRYNLSTP